MCGLKDNVLHIGKYALNKLDLSEAKIVEGGNLYKTEENTISDEMFCCCQIESIILPPSVTTIGSRAFGGSFESNFPISNIELPESLTHIGEYAFQNCKNISSISIPNSVITIGDGAFSGCENLESIKLSENLSYISSRMFSSCLKLSAITIPDKVYKICNEAFIGCSSLTNVVMPDRFYEDYEDFNIFREQGIGTAAFSYCEKLSSIKLPSNTYYINDKAFYGTKITTIDFPSEISRIGSEVFYGCYLSSVTMNKKYFEPMMDDFSENIFYGANGPYDWDIYSTCTLYVPNGYKTTYQADSMTPWCKFARIVEK